MTTPILVLVYAVAAVVVFGIFAGVPMWMIRRHPDTAPANEVPEYLRADWQNLPVYNPAGAGRAVTR
ncbi:MAG TPA: hypothetical protein VGD91_05040 [Trebonia sp.]